MKTIYLLLVLVGILIISGCSQTREDPDVVINPTDISQDITTIENNALLVNLSGYRLTCVNNPIIYVYENDDWRQANTNLKVGEAYFLKNGKGGIPQCDVVGCEEIEKPLIINLIEYIEVGKKEWQGTTKKHLASEFEIKELHGKIKVELNYFADINCKKQKTFLKIIDN